MLVIEMPYDNRCRYRGARSCAGYRVVPRYCCALLLLCPYCTRRHHAHHYALSYVLVAALFINFYRRVSLHIVVHMAVLVVVATGNLRTVISSKEFMVAARGLKERIPYEYQD